MANKTRFIDAIGFVPSELWRLIISRLAVFITLDLDIKRPMLSRPFRKDASYFDKPSVKTSADVFLNLISFIRIRTEMRLQND